MIYLDNAATTPVAEEVSLVISQALNEFFANPSSIYQSGKRNKYLLDEARLSIKKHLRVEDREIYFTSGATEANNWAILVQAEQAKLRGYGNHILSTSIEHPSVLEMLKHLETQGFEVTYLDPVEGTYQVDQFIEATREETIGWVMMWVNNELGTILPVIELGQIAPNYVQWFHVDAVQAFGQGSTDLSSLNATTISASGHKFYAPKGIGMLVYQSWKQPQLLTSLFHGGGQERGLRSGTENLPYILGLSKAFELAQSIDPMAFNQLKEYLFLQLDKNHIKYCRNGYDSPKVDTIINLYFPKLLASQLLIHLDLAGVAISAGSACTAGSLEESHVLKAYYPSDKERYQKSIRLSFGKYTTTEDIDQFIQSIKQLNERTELLWHSQNKQH